MCEEPQRRSAKSYIFLGVHTECSRCREKEETERKKEITAESASALAP